MTTMDQVPVECHFDDEALTSTLRRLVREERNVLADFVVYLAVFEHRRLYLAEGCSSLFGWLTERLRLSNASAFRRVVAARLQARMPLIAGYLRDGRITLTKLGFLRKVLTPENCQALLDEALKLSEPEVEALAVARNPELAKAPPRDTIRPLPSPPPMTPETRGPDLFAPREPAPAPAAPPPAAPPRHEIKMTVGPEFMAQLEEVRAALSHSHPNATLETLLGECMKAALGAQRKRVEAATDKPRASGTEVKSRKIPARVRRAVWKRDGRRCTFMSADGRRCSETHGLQLHHDQPFARGGPPTEDNVRVLCQAHNLYFARLDFGAAFMDRFTPRRT
jgi:5-methylcytosine-specific restriction endonuclease McrA